MNCEAKPAIRYLLQVMVETYDINAITDKIKRVKGQKRTLFAEEE